MEIIGQQANNLVVYSVNVRLGYIGEVVTNDDDNIVFKRALMLERQINPQTMEDHGVAIGPVPYASRDSKVTICKKTSPGILIDAVDDDLVKAYDKEIVAAYSKLKLA